MGVQTVTCERPGRLRIGFYQGTDRLYKISFRARGIQIWPFHTSCGDIEEADQAGGSMADVFKFHAGRFVRMSAFQRLDSGHLVYGHSMAACFMDGLRTMVNGADFIHFFRESFRVLHFLGGMQPATDAMRADVPHILKNGLWFLQKWIPRSLPFWPRPPVD